MKNIFVGNLDFGATDSSVRSLFEPYGQVDRVNVVTDPRPGRVIDAQPRGVDAGEVELASDSPWRVLLDE